MLTAALTTMAVAAALTTTAVAARVSGDFDFLDFLLTETIFVCGR